MYNTRLVKNPFVCQSKEVFFQEISLEVEPPSEGNFSALAKLNHPIEAMGNRRIAMTTPSITQGQNRQIISVVEAAAGNATDEVLAGFNLNREEAQHLLGSGDAVKAVIQTALKPLINRLIGRYPILTETRLLKPVATVTVPARTKPFVASEFFRTGDGLYVYDSFANRFDLKVRQAVDSAPERHYVASLLKANVYDKDIRKELPGTHLSTLEDIAGLIEAQPGGKSGFLLSNGYANIFYVEGKNGEVFVVGVYWYSGNRDWGVHDWELGGRGYWNADRQVFCPGNAVL